MRNYPIDMLGWLAASPRLTLSLERAFAAADRADQDEVLPEHLLAAFLEDVEARDYFARQRADLGSIRRHCAGEITPAAIATMDNIGPRLQAFLDRGHRESGSQAPAMRAQHAQLQQARAPGLTGGIGGSNAGGSFSQPARTTPLGSAGPATPFGSAQQATTPTRQSQQPAPTQSSPFGGTGVTQAAPPQQASPAGTGQRFPNNGLGASNSTQRFGAQSSAPSQHNAPMNAGFGQPVPQQNLAGQSIEGQSTEGQGITGQYAAQRTGETVRPPLPALPAPSRALRKLIAKACDLAERNRHGASTNGSSSNGAGSNGAGSHSTGPTATIEVTSEIVIRAMAQDTATEIGSFLKTALVADAEAEAEKKAKAQEAKRAKEEAKAQAAHPEKQTPANGEAGNTSKVGADQASAAPSAGASQHTDPADEGAVFAALRARIGDVQELLKGELDRDFRYRLVNDLEAFISERGREAPVGTGHYALRTSLGASADPILSRAQAELQGLPIFVAFKRLGATNSSVEMLERALQDDFRQVLAALNRARDAAGDEPLPKSHQALVEAINRLLDVPVRNTELYSADVDPVITAESTLGVADGFNGGYGHPTARGSHNLGGHNSGSYSTVQGNGHGQSRLEAGTEPGIAAAHPHWGEPGAGARNVGQSTSLPAANEASSLADAVTDYPDTCEAHWPAVETPRRSWFAAARSRSAAHVPDDVARAADDPDAAADQSQVGATSAKGLLSRWLGRTPGDDASQSGAAPGNTVFGRHRAEHGVQSNDLRSEVFSNRRDDMNEHGDAASPFSSHGAPSSAATTPATATAMATAAAVTSAQGLPTLLSSGGQPSDTAGTHSPVANGNGNGAEHSGHDDPTNAPATH